jgi:hypothetical protein
VVCNDAWTARRQIGADLAGSLNFGLAKADDPIGGTSSAGAAIETTTQRWQARPVQAWLIRATAFLVPIVGSIVAVHVASQLVEVPTSSFVLFAGWWIAMSGIATVVLLAIDRLARRVLPLVALYRLSLVFPDAAPSRFRVALQSNTVGSLAERVARARQVNDASTPVEAAERLLALSRELDEHDRLTRGHAERVRAYSQMIGRELHLDVNQLDLLNWAALLHDIGKLGVPQEILTKPGKPDDDEWRVLRRHPEIGIELVEPLRGWLGPWLDAVGQHHERFDGQGYPEGRSGRDIALAGRIVAVADVFDVITSARSYKSPFDAGAARNEIARCAGAQFDPAVVRAFLNVSLGRLRLVMGPLSWLTHAPVIGRLPLTPALGTVTASVATVAAALTTGLVEPTTPDALSASATGPPASVAPLRRQTREDEPLTVDLAAAAAGRRTLSVRVVEQPRAGRAEPAPRHRLRVVPAPDFHGELSTTFDACWLGSGCGRGRLDVRVVPVNDVPIAVDDSAETSIAVPVTAPVLRNDRDADGDDLDLAAVSPPTPTGSGTATVSGSRLRFAPATGFSGRAQVVYTAADGHGGRSQAMLNVRVGGAHGPPLAEPDVDVATTAAPVSEPKPPSASEAPLAPEAAGVSGDTPSNAPPVAADDAAAVPQAGSALIDVLANDVDGDGDPLRLVSVGEPSHGEVELAGDRARFGAPADVVGPVTFSYTVADPSGARDTGTVTVTVLLVNAAPTYRPGGDRAVLEDSGAAVAEGWASAVDAGKPSEHDQAVTFEVEDDNAGLFAVRPRLDGGGTLRFTPAPNAFGEARVTVRARDDGGTANGGVDASEAQTFTIRVSPVNDAPSFDGGADQSTVEDAGEQQVPGWARSASVGPPNEHDQALTYLVSSSRPSLFAGGGQPHVSASGALTYTPGPDTAGTATVTVRAHDDGGTADGGGDTSGPTRFTITVGSVNDPPTFAAGSDQVVAEDSGAKSVVGWADQISPGPPDEAGQSVGFVVSTDNPALFSAPPSLDASGTLTFTPAPNAAGSASVAVQARDDGGTVAGGVDTSPVRVLTITVTGVNDPPVALDDAASVAEDDAAGVTLDVLANDTDADPGDSLSVTSFDASAISGTLMHNGGGGFTYVPDPSFNGTETFTYVVDDGNGGSDTGAVTVTVTSQPDAPNAADDAYATPQDTDLVLPAPGVLGNDGDEDGDSLTVDPVPVAAPADGTVSLGSDGSFTYSPLPGFMGTDSFTYRVDDGTGRSATGVVTVTVSASISSSLFYLTSSGSSADVWNMSIAAPPSASPVPDYDADGNPGLTIEKSDGKETVSDPLKWHEWTYTVPADLTLNGPVTLDLWGALDGLLLGKAGHPHVYLYDCAAGRTACVKIAENDVHINPWSLLSSFVLHQVTIGSVSRTIAAGRELRVRVLNNHEDLWVAMTASYPSALRVTR